ncbi:hypothetical protein [Kibdelosporangium aridum]|uniref:Uncharacterized protein n=1 Tax=Kibdelosporangium aridum TaxID=2030 RepID=A0A1Y5XU49_KIBAR|nr:hypothetical protein [Kibdelosporangium aridum]SMD14464.1 hypothetical protein SAMN05661093_05052 [Kibdelosporangium aridum]
MEHQPHRSPDDDPRGPEAERLHPAEIDLTGAIQQDDALQDVIDDAIVEAVAVNGEVPDWGARAIARALANRLDDPISGPLHHFAATSHADKEAIARELAGMHSSISPDDTETRDWINRLGTYVIKLPDQEEPPQEQTREVPIDGTPLEKVSAYFRIAFARADARGEALPAEDAQNLATALSALLLDPDSEMARFADTGDANPVRLHQECQLLKRHGWRTADVGAWIERFEQHLASRTDLGRQPTAPPTTEDPKNSPQVEQGIREAGDAFRAYLTLPSVDPGQTDLSKRYRDVYIGSFTSMDELVDVLADIPTAMTAIRAAAEGWGLADYVSLDRQKLHAMARETWDVVEFHGKFYVFMK